MPKQILTGTLEEQCAFLYKLAQEKAAVGNFSGATHALKEILKYKPDYPGAADLMADAKAGKRQQRLLLWFSLAGAIVGVFVGRAQGFSNDLWLLGLGAAGGLVSFGVGNLFAGRGRAPAGRQQPGMDGRSADPLTAGNSPATVPNADASKDSNHDVGVSAGSTPDGAKPDARMGVESN